MRSLIPVSFLENADYTNPDGSFTRFPDQIWIEGDIAKQSAEHVLILQYKKLLEEVSEDLERSKVKGNSEMNYVLDRINSRIAKVCPTQRAVDEGDSTPSQAESTPENLPIEDADTTPALRN